MSELTTIATPAASERTWQRPGGPGPLKTTLSVIKKDLLIEWRGRARVNATLFFAILTLLLFSFAMGPESKLLAKVAGGFFWLALLLSSVMSLSESMRIERDNDALEGLKLLHIRLDTLLNFASDLVPPKDPSLDLICCPRGHRKG